MNFHPGVIKYIEMRSTFTAYLDMITPITDAQITATRNTWLVHGLKCAILSSHLHRYTIYEDRLDDQLSLVLPSPALRLFADDDSWSAWLLQSLSTFAEH